VATRIVSWIIFQYSSALRDWTLRDRCRHLAMYVYVVSSSSLASAEVHTLYRVLSRTRTTRIVGAGRFWPLFLASVWHHRPADSCTEHSENLVVNLELFRLISETCSETRRLVRRFRAKSSSGCLEIFITGILLSVRSHSAESASFNHLTKYHLCVSLQSTDELFQFPASNRHVMNCHLALHRHCRWQTVSRL